MDLIAGEWLATEVVSLAETGQGIYGRSNWRLLPQNDLQAFDDKILDGRAAAGGGNLGQFKNIVGQIDGGFHVAINT
jgi:hypothetical protein